MGTNCYFFPSPKCDSCEREFEPMHMGKSSAGWAFSLHTYPQEPKSIHDLIDWIEFIVKHPKGRIENEYGEKHTLESFLSCVMDRNHPRGLQRSQGDQFREVKAGKGTWDCCPYEFS